MSTLIPFPSRGIIWRQVLHSLSECPHQARPPAAHWGDLLINEHFIGCLLTFISLPHALISQINSYCSNTCPWVYGQVNSSKIALPFGPPISKLEVCDLAEVTRWYYYSLAWYYYNLLQETKKWHFQRTILPQMSPITQKVPGLGQVDLSSLIERWMKNKCQRGKEESLKKYVSKHFPPQMPTLHG